MDLYGPVNRRHVGGCEGYDGGEGQVSGQPYALYAAGDYLRDGGGHLPDDVHDPCLARP